MKFDKKKCKRKKRIANRIKKTRYRQTETVRKRKRVLGKLRSSKNIPEVREEKIMDKKRDKKGHL